MPEKQKKSRLRFNFGFLLDSDLGDRRVVELDYPSVRVGEDLVVSPLQGAFTVTRTSKGLYLSGALNSALEADCTRCLDPVPLTMELQLDDLFYFPPKDAPAGEYTIGDDGMLDLAPLLRELALLEMPMQVVCATACRGLCPECGQNLNIAACACLEDEIDPRMAALRALLDQEAES